MNTLSNVGRIIYAVPFMVFGINHFVSASILAGFVPSFFPGGIVLVYITGLILLTTSTLILIKRFVRIAGLVLGATLLIFALTVHMPGLFGENMMMSLPNFLKDLSLAGAAFFIAGVFSLPEKI
jgi:putative oxidoreductase